MKYRVMGTCEGIKIDVVGLPRTWCIEKYLPSIRQHAMVLVMPFCIGSVCDKPEA